MEIPELPIEIKNILKKHDSPERLNRHLRLVSFTASNLLSEIDNEWNQLKVNKDFVMFGAATHDIGKVISQNEIYGSGNQHESIGKNLLLENGFSEELSRFALTHGNWKSKDVILEDLLVTLADKIWKGKRINELEELICQEISKRIELDFWEIYQKLNLILDKISLSAQSRLDWQNEIK